MPEVEAGVTIEFAAKAKMHAFVLPFLGSATELPVERTGNKLQVRVPPFERSTVVWFE